MASMPGDEEGIGGVVAPSCSMGGVTRSSFHKISNLVPQCRRTFDAYHGFHVAE